jgi:hypothetical protein
LCWRSNIIKSFSSEKQQAERQQNIGSLYHYYYPPISSPSPSIMSTAVTNANANANASPSCPTPPLGAVHQDPTTFTVVELTEKSFSLKPGESIKSPNGKYSLEFKDGNLALYSNNDDGSHQAEWWSSNTKDANRVDFQTDGNVVVYKDDNVKWASNTVCKAGWLPLRFTLDNEGQMLLILYDMISGKTKAYSPGSRGGGFSDVGDVISFDPNGLFEVNKDKKCILKFQYQSPSKNSKKVTVAIDLNKVVGNSDGQLVIGDKDFAESSKDISAVVFKDDADYVYLQASCMKKDGTSVPSAILLAKSFFLSFVHQVARTMCVAFKKRSASRKNADSLSNTASIYWAFNDQEYEPNDKDFNFKTPNGKYQLVFQGDGNLVLYECTAEGRNAKWHAFASTTRCRGWSDAKKLRFQKDGNMVIYNSDGKPRWASADKDSYEYFVKDGSLFAQGKFLHLTNAGEFAIVANGAHAYNKEAPKDALSKFFTIKSNDKGGFGIQHLVPYKYRTLVIVASVVVGVATVVATAGVAGEFFAAAAPEAALADAEAGMAVAVDAAEAPEVAALGIDLPEAGIVDEEIAEEVSAKPLVAWNSEWV